MRGERSSRLGAPVGKGPPDFGRLDVTGSRPARVIVTPVDAPLYHPLSRRDIQRILSVLPAKTTMGLRSVSLLGDRLTARGVPVFASYRRRGFLRLHAVSRLPWRVPELPSHLLADIMRYGARAEAGEDGYEVTWPQESLRLFYTIGVLLPGLARHRREHEGRGEGGSIIRTLADDSPPWSVTDVSLRQWGDFLLES